MAPEAQLQGSSAGRPGGDLSPSDFRGDQQSVESLIRRLIERVEQSERRYSEALDDLHARLDQLSQTTEALPTTGSAEETETLERLRQHLSSLTDRLEQPKQTDPGFDELAKLDKALAEARSASAGLEAELSPFVPPLRQPTLPFPESTASFAMPPLPAFEPAFSPAPSPFSPAPSPFVPQDGADLDKRLVDMANRLERSIAETNAKAAVETLNARMDELARRFEAALTQGPGNPNIKALERQITDIGQQVGRVEHQMQRIGMVEGELNRLIERFEGTPAQVAEAASKAANEAARLVAENSGSSLSAAQRLDAIHRDLVAMNERSRATDDRVVDTLAAVHESLKGLVTQLERGNKAMPAPEPRPVTPAPAMPEIRARPGFTLPPQRPGMPPFAPESLSGRAAQRESIEADAPHAEKSLRNRLRELDEGTETLPPFGRGKRPPFEEPLDLEADAPEMRPFARSFDPEAERDSIDDLVAAARRASQAAAARAEERGGAPMRPARSAKEASSPIGIEVPERKKRSVLIIAAALLLLISAALLYSRLRTKPDIEAMPPAAEESMPAPAAEAPLVAPKSDAAPVTTDVVPELPAAPEAAPVPNTTPDAAPAPDGVPHPTTPSAMPAMPPMAPPVQVSDAPAVVGALSGVTEMGKTPGAAALPSETGMVPLPASLRSNDDVPLPPGVAAITAPAVSAPPRLPVPSIEAGPVPLREAAISGDPRAQYLVGIRYAQSATPNWTEAARWLSLAAASGLAPAQYRLAVLYERGDGVSKDLGLAKSWYQRAAEQGNVKAMHNLAVAVSRESTSADYALAAKWYEEAASYGLADSQFNLGVLAEHGLGMQKSLDAAYRWFSLAATSNDADAIKRRNALKTTLSIAGAAEADAAIGAFRPKQALPEANQVAEDPAWRVAATPDKGQIAKTQELLNRLGYQAGPADGQAGARTIEAIKAFELREGMDQTGEITSQLIARLEKIAG